MSYTKTTWENGVTPLNATNMNKIEEGIYSAQNTADNASSNISALQTAVGGKVDKVTGTSGDIVTFGSNGAIADSGKKIETSLSTSSDSKVPTSKAVATHVTSAVATKSNKVSSTITDHFVSFSDTKGTLKDSGKSASDFSKVTATDSGGYLSTITIDGTSHTIPQGGGTAGVSSIGGVSGAISLGTGMSMSGQTLNGPDLSGYVEKLTISTEDVVRVYSASKNGAGSILVEKDSANADSIVQRTQNGRVVCASPTDNNHAANKVYVDERVVANDNTGTSGGYLSTIKIGGVSYTIGTLPCLIEGTKILMTDNTEKNIEDVVKGDLIKSYNPTTKEITEAVVIGCYKTGEEYKFNHFTYSNGKSLTVFGVHGYYSPDSGVIKDINTSNFGTKVIDTSLEECVLIDKRPIGKYGRAKSRYNLISSNNLYFANGILLGGRPVHKYHYCLRTNEKMPVEIEEVLSQDCEDYNDFISVIDNPQFIIEAKDAFIASSRAYSIIKADKEKLEKSDYKTLKHTEGQLSEEEYAEALEEREALRQEINEQQSIYLTNLRIIKQLKVQYRNGVTERSLFETCCDRDNEALQLFKDWLQSKGE